MQSVDRVNNEEESQGGSEVRKPEKEGSRRCRNSEEVDGGEGSQGQSQESALGSLMYLSMQNFSNRRSQIILAL